MSITEKRFTMPSAPPSYRGTKVQMIGDSLATQAFFGPGASDPSYQLKVLYQDSSTMVSLACSNEQTGGETIVQMDKARQVFFVEQRKWNWNGEESFSKFEQGDVQVTFAEKQIVSTNAAGDPVIVRISQDDDLTNLTNRHKSSLITAFKHNYAYLKKTPDETPTLIELRSMLDRIDQGNKNTPSL